MPLKMSEKDFDKGYKSGFQFGKEVANEEWMNRIKQAIGEIRGLDGPYVIGDYGLFGEHCPKYIQESEVLEILDRLEREK